MLTAQHGQIAIHEARHCAAALILGATVYVVERSRDGAEGQVLFKAQTVRDRQAILLAPLVHDFESEDFRLRNYTVDIAEAAKNGPLLAGIEAAREVIENPEYRELAGRISRRLITHPVIGPDDIEEIKEAS